MSDCEWMFADAATGILGINALAHLNPLRWSGPVSFDKAIADLEDVLQNSDRPILVKVPANTLDSTECVSTQEAIEYLKSMDPSRVAQEEASIAAAEAARAESAAGAAARAAEVEAVARAKAAEAEAAVTAQAERIAAFKSVVEAARALAIKKEEAAKMAAEELVGAKRCTEAAQEAASVAHAEREAALTAATAAEAGSLSAKSDITCEWMFGDCGIGSLGLALAQMNPLRWSDSVDLDECILQLGALQEDSAERPIVVKVSSGGEATDEATLASAAAAVEFLRGACPAKKAARQASADARRRAQEAKAKEAREGEKLAAARENEKRVAARSSTASSEAAAAAKQAEGAEAAYAEATSAA